MRTAVAVVTALLVITAAAAAAADQANPLAAGGAKPTPPRRPVEVVTVVDKVAAGKDSVDVTLRVTIDRGETLYRVVVRGDDAALELPLDQAGRLAAELGRLASRMEVGAEAKVGTIDVSVGRFDGGEKYVAIGRAGGFSRQYLDAEGAAQLGAALGKVDGVAAWIRDRVGALEKRD